MAYTTAIDVSCPTCNVDAGALCLNWVGGRDGKWSDRPRASVHPKREAKAKRVARLVPNPAALRVVARTRPRITVSCDDCEWTRDSNARHAERNALEHQAKHPEHTVRVTTVSVRVFTPEPDRMELFGP